MAKNKRGGGGRRARITSAIHENVAELVEREVKDPRVRVAGLFTISQVELNNDMSVAFIYASFFGASDAAIGEAMAGLNAARGYLRGPLARRMHLARAPELKFVHDTSPEFRSKLVDIVMSDTERAGDREPDDDDQ